MNKKLNRLEHKYARQDFNDENAGLANLTSTPQGRRALWWLLGECGTFQNSFDGDALTSAYAAGKQAIGQLLIERMGLADPDAFLVAMKENQDAERARDSARNNLGDGDDGYDRSDE